VNRIMSCIVSVVWFFSCHYHLLVLSHPESHFIIQVGIST
jgi:hypothetical protein